MLNVLISVVANSYNEALSHATGIFLRTRLDLVAELDALGLTKKEARG
jgi:hypothetical protein